MGKKEKRGLSAADKHRRAQKKKQLKKNKEERREKRQISLAGKSPEHIMGMIQKINRQEQAAGKEGIDNHLMAQRKMLIEAHKKSKAKAREMKLKQQQEAASDANAPLSIRGFSKIFKTSKPGVGMITDESESLGKKRARGKKTEDDGEDEDDDTLRLTFVTEDGTAVPVRDMVKEQEEEEAKKKEKEERAKAKAAAQKEEENEDRSDDNEDEPEPEAEVVEFTKEEEEAMYFDTSMVPETEAMSDSSEQEEEEEELLEEAPGLQLVMPMPRQMVPQHPGMVFARPNMPGGQHMPHMQRPMMVNNPAAFRGGQGMQGLQPAGQMGQIGQPPQQQQQQQHAPRPNVHPARQRFVPRPRHGAPDRPVDPLALPDDSPWLTGSQQQPTQQPTPHDQQPPVQPGNPMPGPQSAPAPAPISAASTRFMPTALRVRRQAASQPARRPKPPAKPLNAAPAVGGAAGSGAPEASALLVAPVNKAGGGAAGGGVAQSVDDFMKEIQNM